MSPIKSIYRLLTIVVVMYVLFVVFQWSAMRVYVEPDKALIVTRKFGSPLPAGNVVVPSGQHFKGIQEAPLGPGRYFLDPLEYEWQIIDQVKIPAGDPDRWEWDEDGNLKDSSTAPQVAVISLKQGATAPQDSVVVPAGYKGVQKEVLTPGTYKLNPALMTWTLVPAIVVPPGSVGVVTRLVGDVTSGLSASLSEIRTASTQPNANPDTVSRLVVGPTQRGIVKDVLQPGVYYLNPKMVKVTIVPVGYDQVTLDHTMKSAVHFYSFDGYQVEADFTVVWGLTPADAPHIVANIGQLKKVRTNVMEPAMKAACQNEGAKYSAKELIQGDTRSKFQDDISQALQAQIESRNLHVLLVLVRNISIRDSSGKDQTKGLLATIQRANIEVERDLTFKQQTATAMVQAELEQANKLVEVNREMVASETKVKVADVVAQGTKKAAEIEAQKDLKVAAIQLDVARLTAQRTEILGKAEAEVARLKQDAEAQGAKMLVDALGTPEAYNHYIFAKNFEPTDIKMIFAGQGTFWTDLKTFEQVGASKVMQTGRK